MKVSKKKKSYRERQNLQKIFSERRRKYTRDEVSGKSLFLMFVGLCLRIFTVRDGFVGKSATAILQASPKSTQKQPLSENVTKLIPSRYLEVNTY